MVRDAVEVVKHGLPLHVVEDGAIVVAVDAGDGGEHDDVCAHGQAIVDERIDVGQRVVAGVMQENRKETADGLHAIAGQEFTFGRWPIGQEARGPELGGPQAELLHLAQHALWQKLKTPTWDFAYSPGNGCAGNPAIGPGAVVQRHRGDPPRYVICRYKLVTGECVPHHRPLSTVCPDILTY